VDRNNFDPALKRELDYHEQLYSGAAQEQFGKPAVVAFRHHLTDRIIRLTGAGHTSRVLSLGCGIGDTELLLAPRVGHLTGIDLSPRGISQARKSAEERGIRNVEFVNGLLEESGLPPSSFDVVIAVFFLHHLPSRIETDLPARIGEFLKPGGVFYSLDPSRYRLSGLLGRLLAPSLMKKYQTEDEEELKPDATWKAFERAGFNVVPSYYDFASTPLAGLFPDWDLGYRIARAMDDAVVRIPLLSRLSSNFEVVAMRPE
jgi:SAM-dependent methyltransferase